MLGWNRTRGTGPHPGRAMLFVVSSAYLWVGVLRALGFESVVVAPLVPSAAALYYRPSESSHGEEGAAAVRGRSGGGSASPVRIRPRGRARRSSTAGEPALCLAVVHRATLGLGWARVGVIAVLVPAGTALGRLASTYFTDRWWDLPLVKGGAAWQYTYLALAFARR